MAREVFDYPRWMRDALRQVARRALAEVAERGLIDDHHFYLSFHTDRPDVEIPGFLRERFPEEMTVVIQHQFWDLEVDDEAFAVGLSFSGRSARIRVPFAALTTFLDPAAEFGLRFDLVGDPEARGAAPGAQGPTAVPDLPTGSGAEEGEPEGAAATDESSTDHTGAEDGDEKTGEVVSIDRFRKK